MLSQVLSPLPPLPGEELRPEASAASAAIKARFPAKPRFECRLDGPRGRLSPGISNRGAYMTSAGGMDFAIFRILDAPPPASETRVLVKLEDEPGGKPSSTSAGRRTTPPKWSKRRSTSPTSACRRPGASPARWRPRRRQAAHHARVGFGVDARSGARGSGRRSGKGPFRRGYAARPRDPSLVADDCGSYR